jgi:bifunctional polynucleotide phosphatase/kinase
MFTFRAGKSQSYDKIAAFDFDGTLVKAPNGKKRLKHKDQGIMAFLGTPAIVNNFRSGARKRPELVKEIIRAVDTLLGKDVSIYIATGYDYYRKPCTGMWDAFIREICPSTQPNWRPTKVFYCGDAAGRPGDFSNSDILFAHNIGAHRFFTPEQLFGEDTNDSDETDVDSDESKMSDLEKSIADIALSDDEIDSDDEDPYSWRPWPLPSYDWSKGNQEGVHPTNTQQVKNTIMRIIKQPSVLGVVVTMVGRPASGKSSFVREIVQWGGEQKLCPLSISNDATGSKKKSMTLFTRELKTGNHSLIILDNTNPSREGRAEWIKNATNACYKVVSVTCSLSERWCKQLNMYRAQLNKEKCIPEIAYRMFAKRYQLVEPMKEGISASEVYCPSLEGITHMKFV